MSISIGADPEFFLADLKGNFISSIGKIGGEKGKGVKIGGGLSQHFTWLEDNVAVELNFPQTQGAYDFYHRIVGLWPYVTAMLSKKGLVPKVVPTAKFLKSELMDERAHVFGCEPDFDAYEHNVKEQKPIPRACPTPHDNIRYAGGHIHLGFDNKHGIPAHAVAMLCDMYVGLPSLRHDDQGLRRHVYGKAGLYRKKPYGIEYRTMSNWWLVPENAPYMERMSREFENLAGYLERAPDELASVFDRTPIQDVRSIINNHNTKEAYQLWREIYKNTRRHGAALEGLGDYFQVGAPR
jgi:hypothetical protein